TGVKLPKVVNFTAEFDSSKPGIPGYLSDLDGVQLLNKTLQLSVNTGGGGFGEVISGDLALVSNYEAKAKAIAGAVDAFLAENPELYNNTLTFELKRLIEKYVREA